MAPAPDAARGPARTPASPPPPPTQVKRNVYGVCPELPKPRRIPREDVDTCDCPRAPAPSPAPAAPSPGGASSASDTEADTPSRPPARRKRAPADLTGCGADCMNRSMNILCDPRTCPSRGSCGNGPFHTRPLPKMVLRYTGSRGWGGFAGEDIPRGTFVGEYCGEVITPAECARRMQQAKAEGDPRFYMMELSGGAIIDAKHAGGWVRFLNSCCEPNCKAERWTDAATGEARVGLFTTRDVARGEELHYDYMLEHQGSSVAAQGYRCLCGAPSCRGLMDPKADRLRNRGRRVEVEWEDEHGHGRFYRGTVAHYQAGTGEYTVVYDDGSAEKVRLAEVNYRWLRRGAPERRGPPDPRSEDAMLSYELEWREWLDPRGEDEGSQGEDGDE